MAVYVRNTLWIEIKETETILCFIVTEMYIDEIRDIVRHATFIWFPSPPHLFI